MKPTAPDFEPRRDGWFEHAGTWGEVTLGTIIGNRQRRSQAWEIIDVSQATQVQHGDTLWMRARELTTGEEFTVRPRSKVSSCIILTRDPGDTQTPPVSPPSDAEAIMLLVEKLGATRLATRDHVTGEITCPDYAAGGSHLEGYGHYGRDEIEHLRFAHGIDTAHLEALSGDERTIAIATTHGQAHNPKHPDVGKGGFPHRHVPEDLSIYTNNRRTL